MKRALVAVFGPAAIVLLFATAPTVPARAPTIEATSAAGLCQAVASDSTGSQISCNNVTGNTSSVGTGTAASGTGVTVNQHGYIANRVESVTFLNTSLTAAATTDKTVLTTTAALTRILRVYAVLNTNFTGGALSAVTVTCGNSAGGNQYLLSFVAFSGAPATFGDTAAEIGGGLLSATVADTLAAAGVIQCRFTCVTANCNAATAGSLTVYVEFTTFP